jgi:predicted nucleic acid-binding protein
VTSYVDTSVLAAHYTLRTLDTLHLAVAESSASSTLTADKRLATEAPVLGLPVKLFTITPRR